MSVTQVINKQPHAPRLLALAGALALALTALIGAAGWRDGASNAPAAAASFKPVVLPEREAVHELVRFMVSTEQQAADLAASVRQDLGPAYLPMYSFVVVTTPEEEAREVAFMGRNAIELLEAGVAVRLIDLITR